MAIREPGFPSHRNGVGHDEETIGEKRNKDKRSTTSLHSTVLDMTELLENWFRVLYNSNIPGGEITQFI